MDDTNSSRGRLKAEPEPTPRKSRKLPVCKYCKGNFKPLPNNAKKQAFCCDSHRKLHWKYGSQSIGKLAERIERDMRKLIAAELAPMWARLDALESQDRGLPEPDKINFDGIDRVNKLIAAKRGGGEGA